MAEITLQDDFGAAMKNCIQGYAIQKILEIGAFDGDGSTQVLAQALAAKKGEKVLVSLEEKPERFKNLVANTRDYPFVRAVQASSLGWNSFSARDFEKDV
jgi:predicted O-methyltransferase YrrM